LGCSDRFIFVTDKFLATSQFRINNIIEDLALRYPGENRHITATRRLIVVHNLTECDCIDNAEKSAELLDARVKETCNVYKTEEASSWSPRKYTCNVPDYEGDFYYYVTDKLLHIFLVKDPKMSLQDISREKQPGAYWQKLHNLRAIKFLKEMLELTITTTRQFSLLKDVITVASKRLKNYTQYYLPGTTIEKIVDDGIPTLYPMLKNLSPSTTVLSVNEEGYYRDVWTPYDLEYVCNNKRIKTLKGDWLVVRKPRGSEQESEDTWFCVRIEMPGVKCKEDITIKRYRDPDWKIVVEAKHQSLFDYTERTSCYYGCFGPEYPFTMNGTAEEIRNSGHLENGIFTFFVDRKKYFLPKITG